jgi:BMFP domain-containing protein YqiC
MAEIKQPVAPSLVNPSVEYEQDTQNQLHNQLRIYFNTLDAANREEIRGLRSNNVLNWLGGC